MSRNRVGVSNESGETKPGRGGGGGGGGHNVVPADDALVAILVSLVLEVVDPGVDRVPLIQVVEVRVVAVPDEVLRWRRILWLLLVSVDLPQVPEPELQRTSAITFAIFPESTKSQAQEGLGLITVSETAFQSPRDGFVYFVV